MYGQKVNIVNAKGGINLYPESVYKQIKVNDILNVGFRNLKLKVVKLYGWWFFLRSKTTM